MNAITDLILQPKGMAVSSLPLLSSRNCTQTLTPLAHGQLRRTINGQLIHTGLPGHTKYQSTITGEDQAPPALENIWKGTLFQVGCLPYLTQPNLGNPRIELARDPVPDTVMVVDNEGGYHEPLAVTGRQVTLPENKTTDYVSYRPQLDMYAVDFQITMNEWGMKVGWVLKLEEA